MQQFEREAALKFAKTQLRSGKLNEAEALYRRVLAAEPDCAEAVHFLGLAAMQRGKGAEAEALVKRSVELSPSSADYRNNLSTVYGRAGRPLEALAAAEGALELKADFPEALGNRGAALQALGRHEEAMESFRRAVDVRPDYPEALSNLGASLSRAGKHEEAVKHLRRAAELLPRSGDARKNLGNALRRAGEPGDAIRAYQVAIELNPRDADAYNNLGAALQECGRAAEAEEALRACLALDPNHKDAHWNLGLALLVLGRWAEGWVEYEWRQHLREDVGQKRNFPQPVWNGSPLQGRTLLVLCEQGLGDTIQFVRYVPLLARRGAKVIVECQAKLKPLLKGIEGAERVIARGEPLPTFDMHARLMTLPGIFGTTPETVPWEGAYLTGSRHEGTAARRHEGGQHGSGETRGKGNGRDASISALPPSPLHPSPQLRVGIAWQGNPGHKGDKQRSVPLGCFEPLANIPGVRLVSLQKGHGSEQIAEWREKLNLVEWMDPSDLSTEALLETARMIASLDLVIACDTSVAHLAGAMGKPVWVALAVAPDWRWMLEREDTPWYPTMRLFRQRTRGEWGDVFGRIAEKLREMAAEPSAEAARIASR